MTSADNNVAREPEKMERQQAEAGKPAAVFIPTDMLVDGKLPSLPEEKKPKVPFKQRLKKLLEKWPLITRKRYVREMDQIMQMTQHHLDTIKKQAGQDILMFKSLYAPAVQRLVKINAMRDRRQGKGDNLFFQSEVDWDMVRRGKSSDERLAVIDAITDGIKGKIRELLEQRLPRPGPKIDAQVEEFDRGHPKCTGKKRREEDEQHFLSEKSGEEKPDGQGS